MSQDERITTVEQEMRVDGSWRQLERYAMELARAGRDTLAKLLLKEKTGGHFGPWSSRHGVTGHRKFKGKWEVRDYQMWPGEIIHGHPVFWSEFTNTVHSRNSNGVFVGFADENRICLEGHSANVQVKTPADVDAEVLSYFWPVIEPRDEGQQVIINSPLTMRVNLRVPGSVGTIGTIATILNERKAWVRIWEPEDERADNVESEV